MNKKNPTLKWDQHRTVLYSNRQHGTEPQATRQCTTTQCAASKKIRPRSGRAGARADRRDNPHACRGRNTLSMNYKCVHYYRASRYKFKLYTESRRLSSPESVNRINQQKRLKKDKK